MFDAIGKPFFTELARAAEQALGAEDPCTIALRKAAQSAATEDIAAAQTRLMSLPDQVSDRLMAQAHAALRASPALFGSLGGAPPDKSKMN